MIDKTSSIYLNLFKVFLKYLLTLKNNTKMQKKNMFQYIKGRRQINIEAFQHCFQIQLQLEIHFHGLTTFQKKNSYNGPPIIGIASIHHVRPPIFTTFLFDAIFFFNN